jgi:serine/threonine kinase PknH
MLLTAGATLVVGLTSACGTTVDGMPKAARGEASSATGTPTGTPSPPIAPAVGNIGEPGLDGLLLPPDDVRAIMEAPDLAVDKTYAQMPPSTVGYVPEDCASAAFNTVETGYRDSQFTAVRGVVMQEPADAEVLHVVDEGVVMFPGPDVATRYVANTVEAWRHCAGAPFTALRPEAAEHWTFGDVGENSGVSAIHKKADGDTGWSCSHAIAAKANVVIDVSACGFSISDQATTIATRIRDGFPA